MSSQGTPLCRPSSTSINLFLSFVYFKNSYINKHKEEFNFYLTFCIKIEITLILYINRWAYTHDDEELPNSPTLPPICPMLRRLRCAQEQAQESTREGLQVKHVNSLVLCQQSIASRPGEFIHTQYR